MSYVEAAIAGRTGYATSMAIVAASVFLLAAAAIAGGRISERGLSARLLDF